MTDGHRLHLAFSLLSVLVCLHPLLLCFTQMKWDEFEKDVERWSGGSLRKLFPPFLHPPGFSILAPVQPHI